MYIKEYKTCPECITLLLRAVTAVTPTALMPHCRQLGIQAFDTEDDRCADLFISMLVSVLNAITQRH